NKWYDTRYNTNYAWTFTSGKEIKTGEGFKNRILGFNIKTMYAGGLRQTPVNTDASMLAGQVVFFNDQAFLNKNPDYFRTDIKLSMKSNRAKSTRTLSLDIQNVTSR